MLSLKILLLQFPHNVNDIVLSKNKKKTKEKEKSFECKSKIIKFGGIEENISDFNAVLYIQKDSLSRMLSKNDILIFEQNLQPIKFSKNPYSIDYSAILEKQGFCYSQYHGYSFFRL